LVPFPDMESALRVVPQIIRSKAVPTAVEYMSRDTLLFSEEFLGKKFPDNKNDAYLLMTFDGMSRARVEEEYTTIADLCLLSGALDIYLVDTDERRDSVWSARGAFLEAIKASCLEMDECDVVVPRDRIAQYIKFTHTLREKYGMRIPSFGHAGDGNLHIYLCRDESNRDVWLAKTKEVLAEMYAKAEEMGGLVSGEHGIGYAKKKYLREQCGEEQILIMQRIKQAFDPAMILNPGKVCF